jgi:hypothetical protein
MLTNFNIFIFKIYCKYSKLQPIYYIIPTIFYIGCRENIHNLLTDSTQIFLTNYLNEC